MMVSMITEKNCNKYNKKNNLSSIYIEDIPSIKLLPKFHWTLVGDAKLREIWLASNLPEPDGTIWVKIDEQTKRLDFILNWLELWASIPLARNSTVVAFGGGTITDMVGLSAALYMRGIDWHAWPTTLLAQIDAGVGGKTGVDLKAGRNLVGTFHSPKKIVACRFFLKTLPVRQIQSGYWELLKIAIIYGDQDWANIIIKNNNDIPSEDILEKALRAKLKIVINDPNEANERRLLNLGHTIGHAIEILSKYNILHGEAVGFGLLTACYLSEELNLTKFPDSFIKVLINKLAPLAYLLPSWEDCLKQLYLDKKCVHCNNTNNKLIYCVLPYYYAMAQQRILPPSIWQCAYKRLINSFVV